MTLLTSVRCHGQCCEDLFFLNIYEISPIRLLKRWKEAKKCMRGMGVRGGNMGGLSGSGYV